MLYHRSNYFLLLGLQRRALCSFFSSLFFLLLTGFSNHPCLLLVTKFHECFVRLLTFWGYSFSLLHRLSFHSMRDFLSWWRKTQDHSVLKTKMIFPIESLLFTDIVVNFMQDHIYFLSIFNFLLLFLMFFLRCKLWCVKTVLLLKLFTMYTHGGSMSMSGKTNTIL